MPATPSTPQPAPVGHFPGLDSRWRCGHCGNLTRFDVVRTRTVAEFWHVGLDGTPVVTETAVRAERLDRVSCRWCGATDRIEIVPRPDPQAQAEDSGDVGGP